MIDSEIPFRSMLEALPEPVLLIDRDGKILFISRTVPGFTVEQVIGLSAYDFVPPAHHGTMQKAFAEAWETGSSRRYELLGAGAHGAAAHYEGQALPLQRDGKVVGIVMLTTDITQRKRDEEARAELEEQLRESVNRLKTYADELEAKNRLLEAENAERARTAQAMLAQEEAIRALSTPIIQAWEGVLVLPVIGAFDGARAAQLMEKLLTEIVRTRARFAVLDLTGMGEADTSTMTHLLQVVRAAGLLGSRCLISGIAPSIAQTLVSVGAGLEGVVTFAELQDALRHALLESGVRTALER